MMPKFKLLVLRTADMAKAHDFYCRIGLNFKLERHGAGPAHYACEMGGVDGFVLEIYPSRSIEPAHPEETLGFEVASMDAVLACLAEIGVTPQRQPIVTMQGLRVLVSDPDGRKIELIEPN